MSGRTIIRFVLPGLLVVVAAFPLWAQTPYARANTSHPSTKPASQSSEDPIGELDASTNIGQTTSVGNTDPVVVTGVGLVYGLAGTGSTAEPNLKVAEAKSKELILATVPAAYQNNHYRFLLVARQIPVLPLPENSAIRRNLLEELLDARTTLQAAIKLEALGEKSIRSLRVGLESVSPWVRFASAEALAYLGQTDGAVELSRLAKGHPALRAPCLRALASLDNSICADRLAKLMASPEAFRALRLADSAIPIELSLRQLARFATDDPYLLKADKAVFSDGKLNPEIDTDGFDLPTLEDEEGTIKPARMPVPKTHPPLHTAEDKTKVHSPSAADDDPPSNQEILQAMPRVVRGVPFVYDQFREDIVFVKNRIVDKLNPPQYFPLVGPVQLHHCHWECAIYYTETIQTDYPFPCCTRKQRVQVLYIDKDHLHLYVEPNPEDQR